MKNKLLKNLMLPVFMLLGSIIYAQTVSGTISDANGPLPGATVFVKGTDTGTTTDFDGNYTIDNVASDAVLVVSFIGYVTQEVNVANQTVINVILKEDSSELDEVVVVGYTSQTRGDITGSVASVDMTEALKVPVANAADALQGRATGVNVISSNAPGAAPKITIRGFGTTNNTDPLYIIDGVQTTDANILNSIDPSDIAQMNVLKDGAASIYGSRASNGVVIVTTKSGGYSQQRATLSLDMYTGFSQASNLPEMLNASQHMDMIRQSLVNDGAALTHPQYDPNGTGTFSIPSSLDVREPVTVPGTGNYWPGAVTQTAPTTNMSLSLSNGSDSGKYFMSLGYLNRDGILLNTGFKRYTSRLNSEFKILDKLTVGEHLNVAWTDGNSGNSESFQNSLRSSPLIPVYDDNGEFAGTYSNSAGLGNARNPVAQLYRGRNDYNKSMRLFGDIYAELEIMDGLKVKTSYGISTNNYDRRTFTSLDPEHSEPLGSNTLVVQDVTSFDWTWTNTLNYNKTFGEHNVNVLVGVEAVKSTGVGKEIQASDYLFETPDFYTLANGGPSNVNYAYEYESSLFSIFGSVNYNYASKYFVTATLRNDTSSKFLGDNKSGIFPSVSLGWLVSKEDFWPSDFAISRLKLKGSYGELGNQDVPGNPLFNLSELNKEYSYYGINGSAIATGAKVSDIGNPNLHWETSVTTNFGVELGFLQDKLYLSAELFKISTDGLINRDNTIIPTTGPDANAPYVNLGEVKNTGFDLGLGYSDNTDSGFTYGLDLTLSAYKNEVVSLETGTKIGDDFRGGSITRTEVGRSISEFYGRVVEGLDDNGRFIYKEIDGVAGINDSDREYIGSPHPDFVYGINARVGYKGFDMSAFFTGSQGNEIYNFNKIYTDFPSFFNGNRSTRVLDSWTPSNTNTSVPALSQSITNSETNPNSYFVEDGSYFRLKNIQLGYTLPEMVTEKMKMSSLRVYVQATNLFTITGYDGIDPEVIQGGNLTLGVDNQTYPFSQIFTFGVNLKF